SPFRLDEPRWPIISPPVTRVPARIEASAHIDGAWVSPGAVVRGTVVDAIIGPGTVVERGAEVRHCVLMADVKIGAGASVARAVVADGAWIGAGARVGAPNARRPVLVGAGRRLAARSEVPAGAHLDPVDDAPLLG